MPEKNMLLSLLSTEEQEGVKDAMINTAIEFSEDGEDEDLELLKTAYEKLFGEPLTINW